MCPNRRDTESSQILRGETWNLLPLWKLPKVCQSKVCEANLIPKFDHTAAQDTSKMATLQ